MSSSFDLILWKKNENKEIQKLEQKSRKIKLYNVVIYVNSQYDVMSNIIE